MDGCGGGWMVVVDGWWSWVDGGGGGWMVVVVVDGCSEIQQEQRTQEEDGDFCKVWTRRG